MTRLGIEPQSPYWWRVLYHSYQSIWNVIHKILVSLK